MRRAIYKITFRVRKEPETISDQRKLAFNADNAGFERAWKWASKVCDTHEFVAAIELLEVEYP